MTGFCLVLIVKTFRES